jgi:hypothetical protein
VLGDRVAVLGQYERMFASVSSQQPGRRPSYSIRFKRCQTSS